jgi:hypothetical protein
MWVSRTTDRSSSALASAWTPHSIPLGRRSSRVRFQKSIEFVRRAYRYQRQQFVLALDRPACDALVQEQTNESARLIRFLTRNQRSDLILSALMLTISNGPYFGMNYAVAPKQRMDDGLLTFPLSADTANFNSGGTCLYCLWTPRILAKIYGLSCRKVATRWSPKSAVSPRWLNSKRIFGRWTSRVRMHSVFFAQPRRFGHSHNFDSQVRKIYVSLALGKRRGLLSPVFPLENQYICQARRFAPTSGLTHERHRDFPPSSAKSLQG